MDAMTVAVDIAKSTFHVAVADRHWHVVGHHRFTRTRFARFLTTTPSTHIVMEACGTAHYWGRLAQQHGHTVVLLPPT